MDRRVFRMALLTIISAFILVMVIIYATNADKINKLFKNGSDSATSEDVAAEELSVIDEDNYAQQIGDDLNAFLYDEDFFDETEQIPAVVVIQQNTKTVDDSSDDASSELSLMDSDSDDEGTGMAVVGQLDNPDAMPSWDTEGISPDLLNNPPVEGTPVGKTP